MSDILRKIPRRMFSLKTTLFFLICILLWSYKDGKNLQLNTKVFNEKFAVCKMSIDVEKNLSLCLDYTKKEKRDIFIISASDSTNAQFRSYLSKANNIQGLIFNDRGFFNDNNKLRFINKPLLGTEGKRPLLEQHDIASLTAYSLATAFNELNTNVVDIVYLSESKYLENVILTSIATDAIKHIKYFILRAAKNRMYIYSNLLKGNGMIELDCVDNNEKEETCSFLQQEFNNKLPVIQMDYFTKWRHNPDSIVQFANNEAEQLMFEVYLHKYLGFELLMERLYKWILSPTVKCPEYKRFGKPFDGGWDVCLSYNLISQQNCKVYSFGINNDFSFDDAISNEKGCRVRSFDPSMKDIGEKRSDLVSFYRIGLSGSNFVNDKKWTLKSWQSILEMFDDSDSEIDYLKFDIEASEWAMLLTALLDRSLVKVKQMAFEIHGIGSPYAPISTRWKLLKRLESLGFAKWQSHLNSWTMNPNEYSTQRVHCLEIYYINLNYATK